MCDDVVSIFAGLEMLARPGSIAHVNLVSELVFLLQYKALYIKSSEE